MGIPGAWTLPVHLTFVFDREGHLLIKQGINVCMKTHALASSFLEMITSYGYNFHIALAEAEAELAAFNSCGIINVVLTDDVDTLVFGATQIIQNPNVKEDEDDVKIYTVDAIRLALSLMAGIFLLMILCGGDCDFVGLQGCGMGTVLSLSCAGMGDDLLHAAWTCMPLELEVFLEKWCHHLHTTLHVLSNSIPDTFPNPQVLMLYANPVMLWTTGQKPPDTVGWVPCGLDLGKLAALCELLFTWGTLEGIMSCFQEHVWPGMALYGLNSNVGIVTALPSHLPGTIVEGTFHLSSVLCIIQRQKGGKKS
ncbi:hypothetical protein K443DRAFT_130434 [Laccaria amethystina LaAM-08-1]|uniref:XPG-I domain-containing protein n=1 Tax=Laccaria amethystina LaAM-08-1 TaxID=1095629 RepID=A0A0C9XJZ8_9AGAR|nr:hypothetical protein K443DRAFT_130434 [Laccaria amethystina LaAM-08-1]